MTTACGGYGSHRPTGPATSQGFDPSRRDPKKPAFSLYVPAPGRLLSHKFMCKIYIDIKYYKVFILFFHYYILLYFSLKLTIASRPTTSRERVEEQGSRKKQENQHEA